VKPYRLASIDATTLKVTRAYPGGPLFPYSLQAAPKSLAAGEGAVWVPTVSGITAYDPSTRKAHRIPLSETPGEVALGYGAVWVTEPLSTGGGNLVRIDPATKEPKLIPLKDRPGYIAIGARAVWIASEGSLVAVDPLTRKVEHRFPLPVSSSLIHPGSVAVGGGAVWVADYLQNRVLEVNPKTGAFKPLELTQTPDYLLASAGAIWILSRDARTIEKIPYDNQVEWGPHGLPHYPFGFAAGAGAIWVANGSEVDKIDPITHAVRRVHVKAGLRLLRAIAFDQKTKTVWVAAGYPG